MSFFSNALYRLKHGRAPSSAAAVAAPATVQTGPGTGQPATGAGDGQAGSEALVQLQLSHPASNPFLAGRREFTDQFSNLARGKRNWQIVAFISLGLLSVVTVAYLIQSASSRITPYVVEVDALGQARAFGPAERLVETSDRLTIAQLSLFIRNLRTVYEDPFAQKDMIVRAYAYADASAQQWLNAYFAEPENDPRLLARRFSRRVEVKSVIAIPESESWKVSWVEIVTPHGTDVQQRTAWEGFLTVKQVPPTSSATIEYNPLGLYVTAINWTEISR